MTEQEKLIKEIKAEFDAEKHTRSYERVKNMAKTISENLYSEDSHFIYELIQNAQDNDYKQEKKKLDFFVYSHGILIQNNETGFNEEQIRSICDFASSAKKGKKALGYIGEKGIGFKSVFAITDQPAIHSNGYKFYFKKDEYIEPYWIEDLSQYPKEFQNKDTTNIYLPYSKNFKNREDIKKKIRDIEPILLLFLDSLDEINIYNEDKHILAVTKSSKIEDEQRIVTIRSGKKENKFVVYSKVIDRKESISEEKRIGVEKRQLIIAFPLQDIEDSRIFAFLPTEIHTGLSFLIQADFLLNASRGEILKDKEWNQWLLDEIVTFFGEVFRNLRSIDKFEYLNYLKEEISRYKFFDAYYQEILERLKEEKLFLTTDGQWASADEISILESNDFDFLSQYLADIGYSTNRYVHKDFVIPQHLIDAWDIELINGARFLEILESKTPSRFGNDYGELLAIKDKSDEWFTELYAYCYRYKDYMYYTSKYVQIIKLIDGSLNIKGEDCYFDDEPFKDLLIVSNIFKENEEAYKFLEILGTKEIEEKEKIEAELKERYAENFPDNETHLQDVRRWIEYFDNGGEIDFFQNYHCFLVQNTQEEKLWALPQQIYIDEPVKKTGLRVLIDLPDVYVIDSIYSSLSRNEINLLYNFMVYLDAKIEIVIYENNTKGLCRNMYIYKNRGELYLKLANQGWKNARKSRHEKYVDFYFHDGLVQKSRKDFNISLLIWNRMRNIRSEQLKAKYKPNDKVGYVTTDSAVIVELKEKYFIPDKDGNFYRPQDIYQYMLPKEFVFDNRNGWLTAIGFGDNIRKSQEEYQEKDRIVKELAGEHDVEDIEALKDVPKDALKAFLESQIGAKKLHESMSANQGSGDSPSFVQSSDNSDIVTDEVEHQENVHRSNAKNANKFSKASTSYQKQDPKALKEIEDFLYHEYAGHCQICGDTFADGKNVFKTKSLNIGKNRDVNRKGSSLSLCHKHHEIFKRELHNYLFFDAIKDRKLGISYIEEYFDKYDFVGKDGISTDRDAFYMLDEEDNFMRDDVYFLPIRLFGKEEYIKFTKAHIMEFIEVWNEN